MIASNANRKLAELERLCGKTLVIFWNDIAILEKAAEIHAYLKKRGMKLEDADIFIAAIAIVRDLIQDLRKISYPTPDVGAIRAPQACPAALS